MELDEMIRIKEQRGYSIKQLAEYSGVPEGTVRKIFSGQTACPRAVTMSALEKVLTGDESVYKGKNYFYDMKSASADYGKYLDEVGSGSSRIAETVFSYGKKGLMTIEDLESLPEDSRSELIDGILYDMGSPSLVHQDISMEVAMQIRQFTKEKGLKCKTLVNPGVQILRDDQNLLIPDVAVACRDKTRIGRYVEGAPVFVMEVVSEHGRKRDYVIKLNKYSQAGVEEYWIVDPFKKMITIYTTEEDYAPEIIPIEGKCSLHCLGEDFAIDLDEIANIIEEYE